MTKYNTGADILADFAQRDGERWLKENRIRELKAERDELRRKNYDLVRTYNYDELGKSSIRLAEIAYELSKLNA